MRSPARRLCGLWARGRMLARHRVDGGVGGHGVAIVCAVVRRKRWDGWGVCDGGCLHYGIDRVGEFFVLLVVRRRCCWPAVLVRVRCRREESDSRANDRGSMCRGSMRASSCLVMIMAHVLWSRLTQRQHPPKPKRLPKWAAQAEVVSRQPEPPSTCLHQATSSTNPRPTSV